MWTWWINRARGITQKVVWVEEQDKCFFVRDILNASCHLYPTSQAYVPCLLFVESLSRMWILQESLNHLGFHSVCLHSGQSRWEIEQARCIVHTHKCPVVIASADMAGSLATPNLTMSLINYDMPNNIG